jgi:hypothetical protein
VAYDASYDWTTDRPGRWRRWVARLVAVLALAACAYGVYRIVQEATRSDPPAPVTLGAELRQLEASSEVVAVRLGALRPGGSPAKAEAAVREARADRAAAESRLRKERAAGAVIRGDGALGTALEADGEYLALVARVLEHPRTRLASELPRRAARARRAFAALPDPAGLPRTVRGHRRLRAYARAARG